MIKYFINLAEKSKTPEKPIIDHNAIKFLIIMNFIISPLLGILLKVFATIPWWSLLLSIPFFYMFTLLLIYFKCKYPDF